MGAEILAGRGDRDAPDTDQHTTLAELRRWVERFVAERRWEPFHTPKNLAMSMAIESAELMEHFQWLTVEESCKLAEDPVAREAVLDELADVFCYVLAMANVLRADLTTALQKKMEKNAQKYPLDGTLLEDAGY